jgi:pimeloyl-ACP methyl ester carboxylesterase
MWKPLAKGIDWLLSMTLARWVRPHGAVPKPVVVPSDPAAIAWPDVADIALKPAEPPRQRVKDREEELWDFSFASPVESPWPVNQTVRGVALGPEKAADAVILLHGAYEDYYTHAQWMAQPFLRHGGRAFIPAGPCHLQRTPPGVFSGSPMFWSTDLVVASLYQWLAEVRCLMNWLRRSGGQRVGLFGYSLGTLVAGLAAALWDDVDFLALLSPVGSHAQAITHSRVAARIWPWMQNLPADEPALLERWAPIKRPPVTKRIGFFITRYDDLQPTALQEEWWQAWGRPPRWDYPHGHLSVHFCKQFYRDLETFAKDVLDRSAAT